MNRLYIWLIVVIALILGAYFFGYQRGIEKNPYSNPLG